MSRARCCGRARTARLAVCSQAPGTKVHASGTPFTDRSGDRLRDWMGVTPQEFYDEARVAIVPMGFCFPGQDAKGADLPPRRECAPLWHRETVRGAAAARARARGRLLRARLPSRRGGGHDRCKRRCSTGGRHLQAQARARASCRCRIRPGATMRGSPTILVRGRASAGAAARGEEAALNLARLRRSEKNNLLSWIEIKVIWKMVS